MVVERVLSPCLQECNAVRLCDTGHRATDNKSMYMKGIKLLGPQCFVQFANIVVFS